ncbi:MAG TPA: hypothetical protein VFU73_06510 [Actinocrinis sp.]|nr:hypothetical protein [Actinocrinis sp.]
MAARGQSTIRSGRAVLGSALVTRGLTGITAGSRKSPGLLGSIMLTLFGGLFFGVGVYVNTHAADLAAKPGNSGSPKVLGWGFVGIGGLVLLVGALTLLSRLGALIIGACLLIAGRFEQASAPPAPDGAAQTLSQMPESSAPGGGRSASAALLPPQRDPRLPRTAG